MIDVRKKEGESSAAHLSRFTKRIKRSGVMKEVQKRRFLKRGSNKNARRLSAIHREEKKTEMVRAKKLGII